MTAPWSSLACLRERLRQEVRNTCQEWQLDTDQFTDADVDRLICVIAAMPDEDEAAADYRECLSRYEQLCGDAAA